MSLSLSLIVWLTITGEGEEGMCAFAGTSKQIKCAKYPKIYCNHAIVAILYVCNVEIVLRVFEAQVKRLVRTI